MSQVMVLCDPDAKVACQDCDWEGFGADLDMICDFEDRVCAGEIVPAGQCPECGVLCHVVGEPLEACVSMVRAISRFTPYPSTEDGEIDAHDTANRLIADARKIFPAA